MWFGLIEASHHLTHHLLVLLIHTVSVCVWGGGGEGKEGEGIRERREGGEKLII